jgi:branched-chain amino acid transport system permease protein
MTANSEPMTPGLQSAPARDQIELPQASTALRPEIYRRHHYLSIAVFCVATAVICPRLFQSMSDEFLVNTWLLYAIAAIGFYWVFSLGGRFSFCQTFMMALGGYSFAWFTRLGGQQPFLLGVIVATLMTVIAAVIVGLLARRSQQLYFAIATLAVSSIGTEVFNQWSAFAGPGGSVTGVESPSLFGHGLINGNDPLWFFLVVAALVLLLATFIERSPLRREAIASRSNPTVAQLSGIPVERQQLRLFVLGSGLGGFAGALLASYSGTVTNSSFGIQLAIGIFLMLFLGGTGSMWGPVVGAAIYVALPQMLTSVQQYSSVVYGVLLLLVILLLPKGLTAAARTTVTFGLRLLAKRSKEVA